MLIRTLLRIGLISRRHDGSIHWPFHVPPRWVFKSWRSFIGYCRFYGWKPYRFTCKHCRSDVPGRLLPWRWGGGWIGFEFGDRGSQARGLTNVQD